MNTEDILDRLPFELAARLDSDPFFEDIAVVVAVKGNIAQQYAQAQAVIAETSGHRGVAVIVQQIVADDIYEGLAGGPLKLMPAFQVYENVELNNDDNGTGKSARKVARHIIKNMKLAGFRGIIQGMKCARPAIHPVADMKDLAPEVVVEQVDFECQEFSDEQYLYCLPPTISAVGPSQVALATATAGAAIWFTTDDTFPYPGVASDFPGSTSQLYTGPITINPNNFVIRACASQAGFIDSSIERFHN